MLAYNRTFMNVLSFQSSSTLKLCTMNTGLQCACCFLEGSERLRKGGGGGGDGGTVRVLGCCLGGALLTSPSALWTVCLCLPERSGILRVVLHVTGMLSVVQVASEPTEQT